VTGNDVIAIMPVLLQFFVCGMCYCLRETGSCYSVQLLP